MAMSTARVLVVMRAVVCLCVCKCDRGGGRAKTAYIPKSHSKLLLLPEIECVMNNSNDAVLAVYLYTLFTITIVG